MNAVEIEEAVSVLAGRPFDPAEFPYAFLTAFGNKDTTIKRLRTGNTNASDILGGVLQRNHIHIAVCPEGMVSKTLVALRESPKTTAAKAKFVLATDGILLEAEDLIGGETIACAYPDFARHFGFFLPLAGISTVKEIKNNPFDIKATGRLNKLYVELLKDNPEWATEAKRPALNQFIARLIFCFFAEDTGIFLPKQFTKTLEQMSDSQSGNTHEVLCELFRAMDLKPDGRAAAKVKSWADVFPYVNGGMFAGAAECPKFSRIARSYLLAVGNLEWDKINPDIFGSMIQAVADDDERGDIGMHYTSVPNILKVLNPLFLDDLREHLQNADDNVRKLRNLRKRLSTIRVFDPACGSGNFLVIAYKEMRAIEHEIVRRTGDAPKSWIKLENFYGIEIKHFAVEIARLALLIAEFQCDVQYISQQEARAMVLPLHRTGHIVAGSALEIGWNDICPPAVELSEEQDLGGGTGRLALEDNGLKDGHIETYICGNPPYLGKGKKTETHQRDMERVFSGRLKQWGYVDFVGCWLLLAADYCRQSRNYSSALVATNSICQGRQLPQLWPAILRGGIEITFAHLSFKWSNSALRNAGVMCVVIGLGSSTAGRAKKIFDNGLSKTVRNINAYLIDGDNIFVESAPRPISKDLPKLITGSVPNDGGNLILSQNERDELVRTYPETKAFVRRFLGSQDFLQGVERSCLFIEDSAIDKAWANPELSRRLSAVRALRLESPKIETREALSGTPHKFQHIAGRPKKAAIIVPSVSSEARYWFPVGYLDQDSIVSNLAFVMLDAPMYSLAVASSRLHLIWIATVCGKLKNDYRYSNTLGWHTFPIPNLTNSDKAALEKCAEDILIARESHFPATIADLYDPDGMPDDLKRAHEANDEALERIYIGRKFRNDTERLEKLFELYVKMIVPPEPKKKAKRAS